MPLNLSIMSPKVRVWVPSIVIRLDSVCQRSRVEFLASSAPCNSLPTVGAERVGQLYPFRSACAPRRMAVDFLSQGNSRGSFKLSRLVNRRIHRRRAWCSLIDTFFPTFENMTNIHQSRSSTIIVVNVVFLALSYLAVALRLLSRWMSTAHFWWDDLFAVIGLVGSKLSLPYQISFLSRSCCRGPPP